MKKIYLDYAASTPVDKRVIDEMAPFLFEKPGNSSSLHQFGQEAHIAIEEARSLVASLMKANPNEIILLCGEDEHKCDYQQWLNKGHHVFVREF